MTWHFSVQQSQRFSIFFGLLRISELYWSNLEACRWMNLTGQKIWKTKMGLIVAKGHHPIKIWRSTLWMFIRRKHYKMQLLSLKWIKSHNKHCKCWSCDLIFTANISLKDHISSLHQNKTLEMPALWCDICGTHFLVDHISSPHQNIPYIRIKP